MDFSMFVWSKLSAAKWMDAWEDRFAHNPNMVIELIKGGRSIRVQLFCGTKKEADAVKKQFGGSVRAVARTDWAKATPAMPTPLKVRDKFLVTGESSAKALAALRKEHAGREVISIPPEMAFGTGDHATTSTCMRMLCDIAKERKGGGWSVADLGTGTGLLVVAAKKLGAGKAYACDFDPFAVKVAAHNIERNKAGEVEVKEQDILKWKPRKQYDVVLANIFSTVLIQAWPTIVKTIAPGGDLIVSGILHSQAWDVFTAAASNGIGFTKVVRKGKWVTARGGLMRDLVVKAES